jgi:predicted metal-dependent hydrolase
VSAYREADRVVVLMPAKFSRAEEQEWVRRMLDRLAARDRRTRRGDEELLERGRRLARRYLPDHADVAAPASVRWVANQNGRWGSCTPLDRTIRISARLRGMPEWVIDYVLLHEIAHLVVPGHGPRFWRLLKAYPRTERARGYLEGVAATAGLDLADDNDVTDDELTDDEVQ